MIRIQRRRAHPSGAVFVKNLPLGEGGSAQPRRMRGGRYSDAEGSSRSAYGCQLPKGGAKGRGGNLKRVPPHTRHASGVPPSPGRGQNKNAAKIWQRIYQPRESDGPLNLIGTEASGTSVHMAGSSIDNGLDPLHIGLPGTVGTSVGVGNLNTKGYALATKITLRHSLHLPSG